MLASPPDVVVSMIRDARNMLVLDRAHRFAWIGRSKSSQLVIHDNVMSRTHCLLFLRASELYMIDLSMNGTFVNRRRCRKRTRNRLHDGDTLSFDECQETSLQVQIKHLF